MRFAYADPPYLGSCARYDHAHHGGGCWDDVETHFDLFDTLRREFPDGWALSCSVPSLLKFARLVDGYHGAGIRIAAWVNPWHGCTKVSPGCAHCYMFREKERYGQNPEVVVRSKTKFRDPLKWAEPALVFTCSWSDWFHKDADEWRGEAWEIVKRTPHLTYQILTKRTGRIARHLPADWGDGYPNVWLGTSVEDADATFRIAQLRAVPARVRFISAEPLIGDYALAGRLDGIHWVIDGGESGPGFRPSSLHWFRRHRDECAAAGVAYFLKQLGGWPNTRADDAAVLDGVTHSAFPRLEC